MEFEVDNTFNNNTESIKMEFEAPEFSKYDTIELVPFSTEQDNQEYDEKFKNNLKKKQLFKRRVQNKLTKQGENDEDIVQNKMVEIKPIFNVFQPIGDMFAFGEIILEGDFLYEPFNLEKTYSWAYFKRSSTVSFLKDIQFIEVEMKTTGYFIQTLQIAPILQNRNSNI